MNSTNQEASVNNTDNTNALVVTSTSNHFSEENLHKEGETMNAKTHNPVLEFVLNVGDTLKYVWQRYAEWIIDVSWGKLFLACFLTLIAGGLLSLHALANWLVIGSLLLKCFIGKEDQSEVSPSVEKSTDKPFNEES